MRNTISFCDPGREISPSTFLSRTPFCENYRGLAKGGCTHSNSCFQNRFWKYLLKFPLWRLTPILVIYTGNWCRSAMNILLEYTRLPISERLRYRYRKDSTTDIGKTPLPISERLLGLPISEILLGLRISERLLGLPISKRKTTDFRKTTDNSK